jgi:twitching motility protein PilT
MELNAYLDAMHARESLDLHLIAGQSPAVRVNGRLERLEGPIPDAVQLEEMFLEHLTPREAALLVGQGEDITKTYHYKGRAFMLHIFHECGRLAAAIRVVPSRVPTLEDLYGTAKIGSLLHSLVTQASGIIVVTGHTGSGKVVTLAAMIESINQSQSRRILTLEDPIQFEFESKLSLISQRSIGEDVASYRDGVHSAFREDADVVLIGEMLDLETLSLALTLADTGRLVLLPVHCARAAQAIYRMVDAFPEPRGHVRRLLARNLLAVVAQALLPRVDKPGRVAVNEVLLPTPQVRQMISEGVQDLDVVIGAGQSEGMQTMDDGILELLQSGTISEDIARAHLDDIDRLTRVYVSVPECDG